MICILPCNSTFAVAVWQDQIDRPFLNEYRSGLPSPSTTHQTKGLSCQVSTRCSTSMRYTCSKGTRSAANCIVLLLGMQPRCSLRILQERLSHRYSGRCAAVSTCRCSICRNHTAISNIAALLVSKKCTALDGSVRCPGSIWMKSPGLMGISRMNSFHLPSWIICSSSSFVFAVGVQLPA